MNRPYWHAVGAVRGACGHRHRSPQTAQACAMRDHRACHSLGGGAYSDRRVLHVDSDGLWSVWVPE